TMSMQRLYARSESDARSRNTSGRSPMTSRLLDDIQAKHVFRDFEHDSGLYTGLFRLARIEFDGISGGVVAFGSAGVRLHGSNRDDLPLAVEKENVQGDASIFHPEAARLLVGKNEDHAVV